MNNTGNITNSFVRKCLVKAETTASTTSQVSSIAGGITAINSGLISDCYVENDGTSSRTVVATTGINGQADRYAIAGGIVGRMTGGEIKTCYVYRVAINATKRVGGLIAEVPNAQLGNVKITNCYVLRVGFSTAQERAMISADMALAGVKTVIPVDEVVNTMYNVGRSLPAAFRETAEGGLAQTPTGRKIMEELFG